MLKLRVEVGILCLQVPDLIRLIFTEFLSFAQSPRENAILLIDLRDRVCELQQLLCSGEPQFAERLLRSHSTVAVVEFLHLLRLELHK